MRRALAVLFLLLISSSVLADDSRSYILPASKGERLLQQCSRGAPQHITSFFTPDAAQISELEARLGPYLVGLRRSIELQQYGRQYVGFVKDGKQYIYGNFFKGERESIHAASVPVVICDGGETFLGNRKFPGFQDVRGYPV
jgi:hypothetical protein